MRLGSESRRQVGDYYERIINLILPDFGWKNAGTKFEVGVPPEVRKSGQAGVDSAFVYKDPTANTDIGVRVESKKRADLAAYRHDLPGWLAEIDDALHYLRLDLLGESMRLLSSTGSVDIQEALLSVWIDEYDETSFRQITQSAVMQYMQAHRNKSLFRAIHIIGNTKLLQLQAMITQMAAAIPKFGLSGEFEFVYPKLGAQEHATLSYLNGDQVFVRAGIGSDGAEYYLLAFHSGDSSNQQLMHFQASVIDVLGSLISRARGLHGFAWDLHPSKPEQVRLWESLFQSAIETTYGRRRGFVTFQGFNPMHPSLEI